jgi:signal transduction histidine kinase
MRSSIAKVQIELDLRHDSLDQAIKTKQPVVVANIDNNECSGLNKFIKRLQIGVMVIVPLTALGQVVGVLVLEPLVASVSYAQKNLSLFASIGAELGSLVLARRFESRIADAEKMRMASLFASGVAHNFNNMLQAIMGQASLIEIQVDRDSPIAQSARVINEAVSRGASLVQQLKGFSNTALVDRKNFNIQRLLTDSKLLYESILGNQIKLEIEVEGEARDVYADEGQIQRALTNILVNAKEALLNIKSPSVIIKASIERLRSGEVHPELAPGAYVSVSITDNGPGISAEKIHRIFEPFYTTKGVDASTGVGLTGSGLGLSAAYSILKQHDGIITARSEEGRGATFTLYLPVSKAKVESLVTDIKVINSDAAPWVGFFELDLLTTNSLISGLSDAAIQSQSFASLDEIFSILLTKNQSLVVFDAEKADSNLITYIQQLREQNSKVKIILLCVDSVKLSSMLSMYGPFVDVEIVEKSMGVWSLQAAIKRMLGIKRAVVDNSQSFNK